MAVSLGTLDVTDADRAWVTQQLAEGPYGLRQLHYVGWLSVIQRKRRGKMTLLDRMVAISAVSIVVAKKVKLGGRSLVSALRFARLTEFGVTPMENRYCNLEFHFEESELSEPLIMTCGMEQAHEITHIVLQTINSIEQSFPSRRTPILPRSPNSEILTGDFAPRALSHSELVCLAYAICCTSNREVQQRGVLDRFRECFRGASQTTVCDVAEILREKQKASPNDIRMVLLALAKSTWFHAVAIHDIGISAAVVSTLSNLISRNANIRSLSLSRCKLSAKSVVAFMKNLQGGVTNLTDLSIDQNSVGDDGADTLARGFRRFPLRVFALTRCNVGTKGAEALTELFLSDRWLVPETGLIALDLSGNNLSGAASRSLGRYLMRTPILKRLVLRSAKLLTAPIIEALHTNKRLSVNSLEEIDISYSDFGTDERSVKHLASIMRHSKTLYYVSLASVKLTQAGLNHVLQAAINNPHDVPFQIDFSDNDLRGAIADALDALTNEERLRSSINGLIFSGNNLDLKGMEATCGALSRFFSLGAVALDRNINVGSLSFNPLRQSRASVGPCLAEMCDLLPNLKILSVAGSDDFSMRTAGLSSLLESMANNISLTRLDISCNRVDDQGMEILASSLSQNTTLQELYFDLNRISIRSYRSVSRAIGSHPSLYIAAHERDRLALYKSSGSKTREELRNIFDRLQLHLISNANRLNRSSSSCPAAVSSGSNAKSAPKESPKASKQVGRSSTAMNIAGDRLSPTNAIFSSDMDDSKFDEKGNRAIPPGEKENLAKSSKKQLEKSRLPDKSSTDDCEPRSRKDPSRESAEARAPEPVSRGHDNDAPTNHSSSSSPKNGGGSGSSIGSGSGSKLPVGRRRSSTSSTRDKEADAGGGDGGGGVSRDKEAGVGGGGGGVSRDKDEHDDEDASESAPPERENADGSGRDLLSVAREDPLPLTPTRVNPFLDLRERTGGNGNRLSMHGMFSDRKLGHARSKTNENGSSSSSSSSHGDLSPLAEGAEHSSDDASDTEASPAAPAPLGKEGMAPSDPKSSKQARRGSSHARLTAKGDQT